MTQRAIDHGTWHNCASATRSPMITSPAFVRALFDDKLYFKMKDDRFVPNSVEKIANALEQVAQEASKE